MKFPFRILSRSRYERLKLSPAGAELLEGIKRIHQLEKEYDPIFSHASFITLQSLGEFAIIDVGANEGNIALTFARLFPKARIYAVEADPTTYRQLVERFAQTTVIQPVNVAVHSQPGTINFHSNKHSTMSSVLDLPERRTNTTLIRIPAKTLDGLVEELRIENVGVLKVDTEGNDLEVLKGADKLLSSPSLHCIICEFGIHPECRSQVTLNKFLPFLAQRGFYLAATGDFGGSAGHLRGNALFVRKGVSGAQ